MKFELKQTTDACRRTWLTFPPCVVFALEQIACNTWIASHATQIHRRKYLRYKVRARSNKLFWRQFLAETVVKLLFNYFGQCRQQSKNIANHCVTVHTVNNNNLYISILILFWKLIFSQLCTSNTQSIMCNCKKATLPKLTWRHY